MGGSEQVVEQLAALGDNTRVFAPVVDESVIEHGLADVPVSSSGLQRFYRSPGRYAHLLPLLPMAMANADVSDADVVVASHHAFANRVRVPDGVPFISYIHSPARWMWDPSKRSGEAGGSLGTAGLSGFAAVARQSDRTAANRVDQLVANSQTVANRILRWWGRHATVIHPPVSIDFFTPSDEAREDFLLLAGRLVPYKRPEVAIAAATALGRKLVVAGQGRAASRLKAAAGRNVEFLGPVSNDELRSLYRRCSALLFPGEEDFGIIPVEAQACGTPVIAVRAGGVTETVVDGVTGMLVNTGRRDPVQAFIEAIKAFDPAAYDPTLIRANAELFSAERFHQQMHDLLTLRVPGWSRPESTRCAPLVPAAGL